MTFTSAFLPRPDLTYSYFVIFVVCAARQAEVSPTFLHKRSQSLLSKTTIFSSRPAQAARYQCVFPLPSALCRSSPSTELTANVQTVAGIIALLNDFRLSIGKPPLGFLNYWLYGKGRAGINDIVSGSNPGCGTDGFSAIIGWDPVRTARLVSLHFRRWLIFGSAGDGSRHARLCGPAAYNSGLVLVWSSTRLMTRE